MKIVLRGEKGQVLLVLKVNVDNSKNSDFSRYIKGLERLERHNNPKVKPMVFQ